MHLHVNDHFLIIKLTCADGPPIKSSPEEKKNSLKQELYIYQWT